MRRRVSGGRAAGACGGKATGGLTPDISCGTGRCHPDFDPADAELHQSADLKQLETDGAAGGVDKVRLIQADATQRAQEYIGHRGKPQAQLVSPHSGRGGAIGIEIELALLNPILHIAAGTVHFLIEIARFALDAFERGDNEARVGFAVRPLGFGNNSALAAPALARPLLELLKTPCWLAGTPAFLLDGLELARDLGVEAIVLRQSQDKVHAVRLAPGHQLVASKAAVGAQQNTNPWPLSANVGDNACHLLDRTGCRVHARAPQLGGQQMPSAEYIERQIAVAIVVPVEEPSLLLPMNRIVRRIKIKNNLVRRVLVRLQEQVDEKPLDGDRIVTDFVVPRWLQFAQLQPVECRLSGHRRTIFAPCFQLACQNCHDRIMTQLIVIIEILIAERDPKYPLAD